MPSSISSQSVGRYSGSRSRSGSRSSRHSRSRSLTRRQRRSRSRSQTPRRSPRQFLSPSSRLELQKRPSAVPLDG
ncbi:hypothetical protein T11_985, partial [Trichinella zimbabwensis]